MGQEFAESKWLKVIHNHCLSKIIYCHYLLSLAQDISELKLFKIICVTQNYSVTGSRFDCHCKSKIGHSHLPSILFIVIVAQDYLQSL